MKKYFLLLALCLAVTSMEAKPSFMRFKNIGEREGLPYREATSVVEDKHQILWIGTSQGLNRYDGIHFLPFNPKDSLAAILQKSFIFNLQTGPEGNVWVATLGNGLFCYDFKKDKFKVFTHDANDSLSIPSDHVTQIAFDEAGDKWISTINGLYRIKKDGDRQRFQHKEGDAKGLVGNYLYHVLVDRRGHIWVSSPAGVNRLIPTEGDKFHIKTYNKHESSGQLPNNSVWSMAEGLDGKIWMGLVVGDFGVFDPDAETYTSYAGSLADKDGLPYCILPDDKGNVWISDNRRGLMRLNISTRKVERFLHDLSEPNSLGSGYTKQVYKSPSGKWIVAHTMGFSIFQPYDQAFRWEAIPSPNPESKSSVYASGMCKTGDGNLWVGGGFGVHLWNPKEDSWKLAIDPYKDLGMTSYKGFQQIYEDSKGRVWLDTRLGGPLYWDTRSQQGKRIPAKAMGKIHAYKEDDAGNIWLITDGYGISCIEPGVDTLQTFNWEENKNKVVKERFLAFEWMDDGTFWIGSYADGLHQFDTKTRTYLQKIKREEGNQNGLPSDIILDIAVDKKGGLWLATKAGLSHFDPQKETFKNYNTEDGLPSDNLRAVSFDPNGYLWISSDKALSRLDIEQGFFRNFTITDGIAGDDFAVGEALLLGEQMVFLGGKGLTVFNPSFIPQAPPLPQVVLTSFKILNERAALPQAPEETHYIELDHRDYAFTFEFAAPSASQPENLQYATMLKGLDEDWIQMGKNRSATYTVLSPREYTFLAKVWDPQLSQTAAEVLEIKLYIRPAFWQTTLFKVFLGLLAMGLLLMFIWLWKRQLDIRHEKELAEQSTAYKSQFLANMSHEIRTPMHAVLSAAELLAQSPLDEKQERYLHHIRRAGNNLLNLINDILDFSKIEAGKLSFKSEVFSLQEVLAYVHKSLEKPAYERENELTFFIPSHLPDILMGDSVRLGQILLNLLSNAIKFTEKGKVELVAGIQEEEKDRIVLTFQVKDNGVGIGEEKLERIFDSFVQGDNQQNLSLAGVGLGLAITKQLVEQQGGRISVISDTAEGTIFSFYLPFQKAVAEKTAPVIAQATPTEDIAAGNILLVEDIELNRELALDMIAKAFPEVTVTTASSGKEALEVLEKGYLPDLILMDVRMPEMDGLTCTHHIRERYGAIVPIIALTASATEEEMKRCLLHGMDGFLAKPFTPDQLTQTIHDILSPLPAENQLSVDLERLSHFLGHDEDRIQRYLTASKDEIFRHYRSLRIAISQQDWESAQIAAHSLKTTFRYLGIGQIADQFVQTEQAVRKQDEDRVLAGLPDMARAVRGYWKGRESEESLSV